MSLAKILWVDDEIESLHSQILFLENKGYEVKALTNGFDAIDFVKENQIDVVLLDETMPGITGLETLAKIKEATPGGRASQTSGCGLFKADTIGNAN